MDGMDFKFCKPNVLLDSLPDCCTGNCIIEIFSYEGVIMNTNKRTDTANELEDVKINVKLKISALWIAVLFLYVYVDIFSLYKPGIIEGIINGKVTIFEINQLFLFFTTVYIVFPSLMIFLSLVLKPKINRWTNIIVSLFYFVTMLGACIGETWSFYIFGTIVESVLLFLIVRYSWKWPTYENK
jgi:hypothetical protein